MSEDQSSQSPEPTPESTSALYARHQELFDTRFEEIMIKNFVGFERSKFDILERNDSVSEENGHA